MLPIVETRTACNAANGAQLWAPFLLVFFPLFGLPAFHLFSGDCKLGFINAFPTMMLLSSKLQSQLLSLLQLGRKVEMETHSTVTPTADSLLSLATGSSPFTNSMLAFDLFAALLQIHFFWLPHCVKQKLWEDPFSIAVLHPLCCKPFHTELTNITKTMKSSRLTPEKASLLIPVYLHAKMCYKFSASYLSQSQCKQLDKTFRSTIIAKMGYCSKTATPMLNGSHLYGGVGIPSSWDLQGCMHLQLLIGHLQLQNLTGQYLAHNLDLLYLHISLQPRPLSYDIANTKDTAPPGWLTTTWHYLSSIGATLQSQCIILSPQRENDIPIMEIASSYFTGVTYHRINAVRKSKELFFLSDITTSDGLHTDKLALSPGTG